MYDIFPSITEKLDNRNFVTAYKTILVDPSISFSPSCGWWTIWQIVIVRWNFASLHCWCWCWVCLSYYLYPDMMWCLEWEWLARYLSQPQSARHDGNTQQPACSQNHQTISFIWLLGGCVDYQRDVFVFPSSVRQSPSCFYTREHHQYWSWSQTSQTKRASEGSLQGF